MKTIYKYLLEITDEQTVSMPIGAQVLSAQMQGTQLCIWALVYSDNVNCDRRVRIFGTGNPVTLEGDWKFVDSVQERIFVWHIFIENK
jgi:hypothetical protein